MPAFICRELATSGRLRRQLKLPTVTNVTHDLSILLEKDSSSK